MVEPDRNADVEEDMTDVCLKCRSRREDDAQARSALRKVTTLTAICCVLCVLTVSACACSLYFYTHFRGFHQELVALVRSNNEDADEIYTDHFTMEYNAMPMYGEPSGTDDYSEFESENTRNLRHRRKKEKGKRKCNRKKLRTCDCCKQKLSQYIDTKMESMSKIITTDKVPVSTKVLPAKQAGDVEQKKSAYLSAAHYTTYVDEKFINQKFGELDHDLQNNPPKMKIDIQGWQGTLFRNRTFVTSAAPLTLRFFKESDWMKNSTTPKIFDFDQSTGKFTAKYTGLYHLYAHVLFYDVKTRMAIGLLHESKKGVPRDSKGKESIVFRCMESVDYVNPQLKIGHNAKFKSCNVNGVLFLNQGDTIAMQSLYKHTCLDLTYDATYFGAIYISTPNS